MSRDDVEREILDPMLAMCTPSRVRSDLEMVRVRNEYFAQLEEFDGAVLKDARIAVFAERTLRDWPMPGVFRREALRIQKRKSRDTAPPPRLSIEERNAIVWERVKRTELARRAVELNCAHALKNAILDNGIAPHLIDLDSFVKQRAQSERTVERILRGEPMPMPSTGRKPQPFSTANQQRVAEMFATKELLNAKVAEEILAAQETGDHDIQTGSQSA